MNPERSTISCSAWLAVRGQGTFFKYLAIQDEWFTDDVKRLDDKKVYEYLQGHWIVEMSEMNAVANAKSIEETKSFLSRQKDTYRIPYERRAEETEGSR